MVTCRLHRGKLSVSHHGRKAFRMYADFESPSGSTWLHYSDQCWWLADCIEGNYLYGVARQSTMLPPQHGWQVPPYEAVKDDLCLVLKRGPADANAGVQLSTRTLRDIVDSAELD